MKTSLAAAFLLWLATIALATPNSGAQQAPEEHFQFQIQLSLGLSGINTHYAASLRDENGFQYDSISVIRRNGLGAVALSQDQKEEWQAIYLDMMEELKAHPSSSMLRADDETAQDELESIFREALNDINSLFSEDQKLALQRLRHRDGIQQIGFEKYLGSSHFGDQGLPESDIAVLKSLQELWKQNVESCRALANRKLLEAMEKYSQRGPNSFEKLTSKKTLQSFLNSPLFTTPKNYRKRSAKRGFLVKQVIGLKITQRDLGVSPEVAGKIASETEIDHENLKSILDDKQFQQFSCLLIAKDIKAFGTVNTLCSGHFSSLISLSDSDADKFHKEGKKIYSDLAKQIKAKNMEQLEESLKSLKSESADRLRSVLETLAIPKTFAD